MHLDNALNFHQIDKENMLAEIDGLPQQLFSAYSNSANYDLTGVKRPDIIVVAGMGGSAIGADLLSSYCSPFCSIPVIGLREYTLPAWAMKKNTLVVASSHSGNTEEALSVFEQAFAVGIPLLAVTTGGEIAKRAQKENIPFWEFEHQGQPRAAVGFSFGILLALLERLDVIPSQKQLLAEAVEEIEMKKESYKAESPIAKNPAKRLAGQAISKYVSVFGADHLAPVARRWKTQVNELAKAWAQFEFLPEADHNTLAGIENDEKTLEKVSALFLKGSHTHPRNLMRADLTKQEMMVAGIAVDAIEFKGASRLSEMWDAILFGDYFSYYLALSYDVDPTPVDALSSLKQALKK
jgi:glucose/mannose-6-phosphate isomerase